MKDIALAISKLGAAHLTPKGLGIRDWLRICHKKHAGGLGFSKSASSRSHQSRFFGECICVYDRAVSTLMESGADLLSNLEGSLAPIFTHMGIQIVR